MYNKKGWAQNSPWNESYIEKYLPLVKRLAGRLAISLPAHIKEEDLLSYGLMGLLDALKSTSHPGVLSLKPMPVLESEGQ